jgi:glycosyltransferase involved in cell wall biosynthesis
MITDSSGVRSPKVSVIIPNYNHARYLSKRLDTVLSQTYQDFEVIALDDASPDNSVEILRRYEATGKVRLVLNERNSGTPFAQWKRGLALAKGEYTWIAESDDFASPFLLEKLVAAVSANHRVGLAYCQSYLVDETDKILRKYDYIPTHLDPKRWEVDFVNNGADEVARYLFLQNMIPNASAVLAKTSLLISACEHADKLRLTGDWWTYVEVLMQGDIAFIAEPLNHFRMHSASVRSSTKKFAACAEALRVRAHICSKIPVESTERQRAIKHEFQWVWSYLDSWTDTTDPQWIRGIMKSAKAIHWSAVPRLWMLKIKRLIKRIPFLTAFVRRLRRAKEV